jgi:hypothetical protein
MTKKSSEYCLDCGGLIAIRNPTGKCDHLYYPENKLPKQQYPEHEKLKVVQDQSQQIGNFLDWLSENQLTICNLTSGRIEDQYLPTRRNQEELLADYFDIDLQKIESEKRKMLKELRK